MSRRRADVRYKPVSQKDGGDDGDNDVVDAGFSDAQFAMPVTRIPWKAIALASFLFIAGTISLTSGILIVTGHIDTQYSDRFWPLIVLGLIMFIPGSYHIRIAYCSFLKRPGYSFSDIPEFD